MSRNSKNAQRIVRRVLWRMIGLGAVLIVFALCVVYMIAINLSDIRALLGL